MKTGPKPILQPDDIDGICEMVCECKTVRQIAAHYGCSVGTLMRFVGLTENVEHYTRARETASDLFESDIIMTAEAATPETAAADRIKVDALKWVAAHRAPKKYGDRLEVDAKGVLPMVIVRDLTGRKDEPEDD